MTRKIKVFLLGVLVLALAGCMTYTNNQVTAVAQTAPSEYDDSGACPCSNGLFRIKFDNLAGNPNKETFYTASHGGLTVTIKLYGGDHGKTYVDWSSNLGIDQVIVKGGREGCNYYNYDPEAKSDSRLHAPEMTNPQGTQIIPDISFVAFCWDAELVISKEVTTEFTRYWDWEVRKTVTPEALTLNKGESGTVDYTIAVTRTYEDKDFKVSGTITIYNPAPVVANVRVVDTITGVGTILDQPITIPANSTVELVVGPITLPDGEERTNVVTVTSPTPEVIGGTIEVPIKFSNPTEEVDEKAKLEDALTLPGGLVLSAVSPPGGYAFPVILSEPKTFTYSLTIRNESLCNATVTLDNTATLTELESGTSHESSASVAITARPCVVFCGCSHGYWKNHTDKWPAPYTPTTTLGSVFTNASLYGLDKDTFLKALNYKGGSTLTGAAQLLLMQAVAAVLNAQALEDKFPYTVDGIISAVNEALDSKNRTAILNLKDKLDAANNLGCPF